MENTCEKKKTCVSKPTHNNYILLHLGPVVFSQSRTSGKTSCRSAMYCESCSLCAGPLRAWTFVTAAHPLWQDIEVLGWSWLVLFTHWATHPSFDSFQGGRAFHGTNWSVQAITAEVLPQGLSFSFSLFLPSPLLQHPGFYYHLPYRVNNLLV